MHKTVYLDSTIPSYLFDQRDSIREFIEITKKWWEEERGNFRVVISDATGDALHLAYASAYKCEFLLTWNCNHLANANKKQHIAVINTRLKLFVPEIVTPMELFTETEI